ncbi:MAG TPA: TIGR03435 family protein [Bryobacteraceae bacterium]
MRKTIGVIFAAVLTRAIFAQGADTRPVFEIADVHASAKTLHPSTTGGFRSGRYELRMATMSQLIAAAYGVEPEKVDRGPNWLDLDRFDVIAKAPPAASPQDLKPMLQSLLAERFQLLVHSDSRPMPAFVLSVGSTKPKLKRSDSSGPPGCQRQPQASEAGAIPTSCHGLTMEAFAAQLRVMAGDYLESPVLDGTKLEGAWDFDFKWTPRGGLATAGSSGITIFDAVGSQLGLKLESKEIPAPVVVVDRVNRKPTDNPPGVAAILPALQPPHFEVATVKPTDPNFHDVRIQTPPNGQVLIQGLTLSYMIQTIWFLTPDMVAGAPKWFDTDRWDIVAKVAPEPDRVPGGAPRTDMDSMIAMVRELLEDRFKLRTHIEDRVVPAYTLTAVSPKLQKADPSERTGCKEGLGADGKDPRISNPTLSRLVSCRNMTMAQFAEFLPGIANVLNPLNGTLRSFVLDSTRLDGAYDFTLSFSPNAALAPAPSPGDGLSDPNGAISLFEAIGRQLGLKLALQKRRAPVLVIDHVERNPADN